MPTQILRPHSAELLRKMTENQGQFSITARCVTITQLRRTTSHHTMRAIRLITVTSPFTYSPAPIKEFLDNFKTLGIRLHLKRAKAVTTIAADKPAAVGTGEL
jgi:hypothetical protein